MPDGLHFDLAEKRLVTTEAQSPAAYSTPRHRPHNRLWRWTLRLALPTLAFLSGLALYWIWFDQAYGGTEWTTIIVGLPLAVEAAAVTLWSISAWSSNDLV
ncbi:MAG: hypothetical protein JSR91_27600 [Proteobacteria bacterium]|nr:hypothetical protein [Pseudomonadota bacterium]